MNAQAPQLSANFPEQLAEALQSLANTQAERQTLRAARAASRGKEAQSPEDALIEKRAEAARIKQLNRALCPLASIGLKSGIEMALEQGASLAKGVEKGVSPAMAAILGKHPELALWLTEQPSHAWAADAFRLREGGQCVTELSCAVHVDNAELSQALAKARPSLLAESRGMSGDSLFLAAMSNSPRCAAWLIQAGATRESAQPVPHGRSKPRLPLLALARSLANGDFATASIIHAHAKKEIDDLCRLPILEQQGAHELYYLVDQILRTDDSDGLGWLLKNTPSLCELLARGVQGDAGCARSHFGPVWTYFQEARKKSLKGDPAIRSILPIWAACQGASDCLTLLLGIDFFAKQMASVQSTPGIFWQFLYTQVNDPTLISLLEQAGFDFTKPSGSLGYVEAILYNNSSTIKWLEMVGREKMSWLVDAPFDTARARQPYRSKEISKAQAVCEKAAMRVGSARAKPQTAVAKAAASARRRL